MAYRKRSSKIAEEARQQFLSISAIEPQFNFGGSVSSERYTALLEQATEALDTYNKALAAADAAGNALEAIEKSLQDMMSRVRNATAAIHGRDSEQYEMAGGVRTSERKRPSRKVEVS